MPREIHAFGDEFGDPGLVLADSEIRRVVGGGAYERGRAYARQRMVRDYEWDAEYGELTGQVAGSGRQLYLTDVDLDLVPGSGHRIRSSSCSCPVGVGCKHVAALLLTVRTDPIQEAPHVATPSWQHAFDVALSGTAPVTPVHETALQFEIVEPYQGRYATPGGPRLRVAIRPVTRGKSGKWIKSEVTWRELPYAASLRSITPRHLQVLLGIQSLHSASARGYVYGPTDKVIHLDELNGGQLWDLLAEAQQHDLPLIQARKDGPPIDLGGRAEALLDLKRSNSGLDIIPTVYVDGVQLASDHFVLIGGPRPSGLHWWTDDDLGEPLKNRAVRLAPFAEPISAPLAGLLKGGSRQRVPQGEVDDFLLGYYPRLASQMRVESHDGSVEFPDPPQTVLRLSLQPSARHLLALHWDWDYRSGEGSDRRSARLPLWPTPQEQGYRDPAGEAQLIVAVSEVLDGSVAPGGAAIGSRLAASSALAGVHAAEFVMTTLPKLREVAGLEVNVVGDLPDYRRTVESPVVSLATTAGGDERDWFDLSVTVTIEGEEVALDQLFLALAELDDVLVLPSGLCLGLDHPTLLQLRALLDEARALQDRPSEQIRLSRFQVGLWSELEALGVVTSQADDWLQAVQTVQGLTETASGGAEIELPASVHATLRPYQHAGFAWLSRLHDARLGGILADDMGLGKTLQVLAMMARIKERQDSADSSPALPFIVVAPTSVASNWLVEAARFVPDLKVTVIEQTGKRRGEEIAAIAARSDVVITSYTLFRLEYDDYDAIAWEALILDEAQFVKNHQSKAYSCAKRLDARMKIAVTGTPMENNLMELWALLGLTAPGLFASPKRFTDYYRTPIERNGDKERLAQLHRRLRPLMLRRAKEEVALDLPAKQEQIVSVELATKHRVVYDRYLNRERQKVLGLMEDFDGNRFEIFRSLMLLRRLSIDASLVDEAHAGVPATKLDVLDDLLAEAIAEGHRILVFSQFTGVLSRVKDRLNALGVEHCYLDGTTKRRSAVIDAFREGKAPVFLISLKAGGFGLNLTEADYCILLDPWWNPAVEAQAVDRAHRIGQQRTVMVYRLVAKDTIEEKVMALKAGKARLFDSVIGDAELSSSTLSASDIRGLLE